MSTLQACSPCTGRLGVYGPATCPVLLQYLPIKPHGSVVAGLGRAYCVRRIFHRATMNSGPMSIYTAVHERVCPHRRSVPNISMPPAELNCPGRVVVYRYSIKRSGHATMTERCIRQSEYLIILFINACRRHRGDREQEQQVVYPARGGRS